jgi:exosome complex RNA-binding protein Rrp42 (RNase PH superfamily)
MRTVAGMYPLVKLAIKASHVPIHLLVKVLQIPLMERTKSGLELQPKMVNGQPAKKPLKLQHCLMSASVCIYKGEVVVDPTRQEEEIIGSTLTVIASDTLHGVILCF